VTKAQEKTLSDLARRASVSRRAARDRGGGMSARTPRHRLVGVADVIEMASGCPRPNAVDHPPHYMAGTIECIDALRSMLGDAGYEGYLAGCAVKYIWRYRHKGSVVEDLQKARWYLDRLIALSAGDES